MYRCNICKKRFSLDPFPRFHYPIWVYEKILRQSAEGERPKSIAKSITEEAKKKRQDMRIAVATILFFLKDIVALMVKIEEEQHHNVLANTWQIDDCFQKLPHGIWAYITNVMAIETRYWLASNVSIKRNTQGSIDALNQSILRSGYSPVLIECDGLKAHSSAIKKIISSAVIDQKTKKKDISIVNHIERLNRTMRRIIRKGKCYATEENLWIYLNLVRLQYNFLEKHTYLKKTPAEAAGINLSIKSWKDLIQLAVRYKERNRHTSRKTIRQFSQSLLPI
jgi:hypothetical protein